MKTIKLTGSQAEHIVLALMDSAVDNMHKGRVYTAKIEAELTEALFPAIRVENVKTFREAIDSTQELIENRIERDLANN